MGWEKKRNEETKWGGYMPNTKSIFSVKRTVHHLIRDVLTKTLLFKYFTSVVVLVRGGGGGGGLVVVVLASVATGAYSSRVSLRVSHLTKCRI